MNKFFCNTKINRWISKLLKLNESKHKIYNTEKMYNGYYVTIWCLVKAQLYWVSIKYS